MINKQGQGKIDWTDWSWNPISGCKHGCEYCYMLRMEKRFPGIMEPKFHPDRISKLARVKKVLPGDKIFVGSSGDMWGAWVPDSWIEEVLWSTQKRTDIVFQFLTKHPTKYSCFDLSEFKNCWFGTTLDGTLRTAGNITSLLSSVPHDSFRFVSFEPLLGDPENILQLIKELDWIIIGADSNQGADKPPMEWANSLIEAARANNVPVFVKDNYGYRVRIKEFNHKGR